MRIRGLHIAAAAACLVLVGLGTWQLQRRTEKLDLVARHAQAMRAAPQAFPANTQWDDTDFKALEFRKVHLAGRYLNAPEVHLFAVLPKIKDRQGGVGWWVLLPLELDSGGVVFVNRGFIPQELKHPSLRPQSLAMPTKQEIDGLVRLKEEPGRFTTAPDPKTNEWYLRDPAAFAAYASVETSKKVAPVVVDQISSNANVLPQPVSGEITFANNHLQYAITWYALAVVLIVMTFLFHRRRNQKGSE